ncbi:MAG: tetratricopeptide repeat protein [bacterium]|nr:tetratricopeptide repeat protein [bacterium]
MMRNDRSRNLGCDRLGRVGTRSGRVARWMAVSVSLFVALSLIAAAGPAFSQVNKYQFGKRNLKKMAKLIALEQGGDRAGAKEMLESINLKRARPYGRARVMQLLGSFAAQEEDFETALVYLEGCVAENALPPIEQLRALYLVGQLQTMLERFDDAIVTLESWISQVEAPAPSSFYTLAVTYYQAERPEDAVAPAKKAVELSDEPRESWYRLLLSLYLERQEYPQALALLDDIILTFPKKAYWSQMAAIYSELDEMDKSLAVQQLSKSEGFITEDRDLTRVAQMFMVEGLPHRGAAIMKQGLQDGSIEPTKQAYQTYSDTLLQSREWALAVEPLTKAAELNDNGSLFVRLAQVNLQLGRWGDARSSLSQAFDKGDLSDEGQAQILMGIAAANDKKWVAATRAFSLAQEFDGTAEVAGKWKAYVEREKARLGD